MRTPPLPDVAFLIQQYLRTVPEVAAIAGGRIYTAFPRQLSKTLPFVLVQRIGGIPPVPRPLVVDLAALQLDAYGGRQADAHLLAATCLSALAELEGEQPNDTGNVCGVVVLTKREQDDETYKPPRPRFVCDLEVTVKPAGAALAGTA
jgi:hypothetical protein